MATRNRTIMYRKYRDSYKNITSTSSSTSGGAVIELSTLYPNKNHRSYAPLSTHEDSATSSTRGTVTVGLPPAWVDVSEEIAANIQSVRGKVVKLAKAHAEALLSLFRDGKEDQRRIEALTHEITDLLRKSEKKLQKLSAGGPSEDANIRKNVQRSLATDLQTLSMELRRKQSTYLKRLKLQKEGPDGVDLEMNLGGSNSKMGDDDLDDMGFSEHQMAKIKKSEAFTAEREKEIQQVVESVNELAQIMKDLSVLVIDQGDNC